MKDEGKQRKIDGEFRMMLFRVVDDFIEVGVKGYFMRFRR